MGVLSVISLGVSTCLLLPVLVLAAHTLWTKRQQQLRERAGRKRRAQLKDSTGPTPVLIIGAGFSGICQAVKLKEAGVPFRWIEKERDIGGTWLLNTYPGCACDIPAHLYSFSFNLNPSWSSAFAPAREIHAYLHDTLAKFGLTNKTEVNETCVEVAWQESTRTWRAQVMNTVTGVTQTIEARFIISGVGGLHHPSFPPLDRSRFQGDAMHSAEWNSEVDLHDKRVVVVGSAASAIQLVPEIMDQAKDVYVLQRTPNWIAPRKHTVLPPSLKYGSTLQWIFKHVPLAMRIHRVFIYAAQEYFFLVGAFDNPLASWRSGFTANLARKALSEFMLSQLGDDQDLIKKVIPEYPVGCKRILRSEKYLAALKRNDVHVVCGSLAEVKETSVVMEDGTSIDDIDAMIWATGFKVGNLGSLAICGAQGFRITGSDAMDRFLPTHLGIVARDAPNAFLLLGPATGLGHNSIILMTETQCTYVTSVITQALDQGFDRVEVKQDAVDKFGQWADDTMKQRVWLGHCTSWYQNGAGKVPALWPASTLKYFSMAKVANLLECFEVK